MSKINYDEAVVSKAKSVSWGKVGDFVTGTIVSKTVSTVPDTYKNTAVIYEIMTDGGFYHEKDRDAEGKIMKSSNPDAVKVTPEEGEIVTVWAKIKPDGSNSILASQMDKYPLGAYVKVAFTETKPSDFGNDSKYINSFAFPDGKGGYKVNEEWLAKTVSVDYDSATEAQAPEGSLDREF